METSGLSADVFSEGPHWARRAVSPYLAGRAPRMIRVYELIRKIAEATASVLIQGENGTGKELIARILYHNGPRRTQPFVAVDCTAIPDGLMESQLFGHVRGAFTGAVATVPGVLSRAHTGTLFLDEIGEMPLHLQAKLLRVIQTREFTMVGGTQPQRVDVRIISATNRDLRDMVRRSLFREDLYYRLAVVTIDIPPLRERKEDIPFLVDHFLRGFAGQYRKQIEGLTERAMARFLAYPWPGNVRELENCLEQAVLLAEGKVLDSDHFPSIAYGASPSAPPGPVGMSLHEMEKRYILDTLERVDGNRSKAAKILQISVRGLQYKLQRYANDAANGRPGGRKRSSRLNHLQRPAPPGETA
ncbi:MAG TPA: sigma-54 dependent transcriptional regulator [Candidatus Binatia bacterium]|nr:sigma-54 dependent transcriptional regulator [Candidatus Binatia bacterium]